MLGIIIIIIIILVVAEYFTFIKNLPEEVFGLKYA